MKQKQNENLGDYSPRFNNAKDTYTLPGLSLPTEESPAITYIQGYDPSKILDLLTSLYNELRNGRDLFPTDLAGAISKAFKWLVSSPKGPREATQHSVYGALATTGKKTNQERGKNKDKEKEKEFKSVEVEKNDNVKGCAYCNKAGHNILKCLSLSRIRRQQRLIEI